MEFIEALHAIVTAMPAFRDEQTVNDIRAALDTEQAKRDDYEREYAELADSLTAPEADNGGQQ